MVGSGCLAHGRFISEHNSAQCLQSPCSSSCRAWGQSKQGWWRSPPGNLHPSGLLSLHLTTAWVWAVQLIHRQARRSPLPASLALRGHRSYKGFRSLLRFFCVCLCVCFFFFLVLIYLVAMGFSWGTRDLRSLLQHAGLLVMAWVRSPSHWSTGEVPRAVDY